MVKVQFKVSSANNLWYLSHMAKYKNRTVKLNKPSRGDVKKFKVFVKDKSSGRVKKVNFGSKEMSIKKHIPARKRSFMARMGGVLKKVRGQKSLSPAYWSIQSWKKGFKLWWIDFLIKCLKHLIGYLIDLFQMHQDVNVKKRKNNLWG